MVVPPGGGLVPPAPGGPAQPERQAGRGEQPGRPVGGQAGEPGGLGDRQPDQAGPARAGLAGVGGDGRVAEGDAQVSVVHVSVGVAVAGCALALSAGGRSIRPHRALRMAAWRSWASAASAVCRQAASQVLTWDWSQPSTSFPVLNVSSTGQRRPAMAMKYGIVAGLPSGA